MSFSAKYIDSAHHTVQRSDLPRTFIPATAANRDFREILEAGVEIASYEIPVPAGNEVIAERDRRLSLGFDHNFGDVRGVHRIATTPLDMAGWDEVTKGAQAEINLGHPETEFQIVTETGAATVTALEWQSILAAATAFRQPIWAASFALMAQDPIPADYADDAHWP